MKSLAKSEATIRELKARLEMRFSGSATIDTVREARDADGWSCLICSDGGNEAAGQPVIGIRVKADDAVSKDVFGNALTAFTPHTLDLAYELDTAEGEPSRRDLIKAMSEIAKLGFKIAVKEIADGTAVTPANIAAAAVTDSLEADVQWPTKGM